MKRLALWCLLASGCVNFDDAQREFCDEHPEVCGDAGLPSDAGVNDAGVTDAGPSDAGSNDAGAADAGFDAGRTIDAGELDAGTPDAGAADAGNSCTNGVLDMLSESDVDCGGMCAPCDVGRACNRESDCQTTFCPVDTCALVTAGPTEPGPAWRYVGLFGYGNIAETDGRSNFAFARIGNTFHIAGGAVTLTTGGQADRASNFWLQYTADPASPNPPLQGIVTRTPMPGARQGCWGVGTPRGEFFVFGGAGGTGSPVNTFVRAVVADNGWDAGLPLSPRFNAGAPMSLPDGGALVLLPNGDLVTLNPYAGFVDAGAVVLAGATAFSTPALAPNGDVYVFAADGMRSTVVRREATGQTMVEPSAPRAHGEGRALLAPDGRFYVMGRGPGVDAFSPGSRFWAEVAPLQEPHDFGGVGLGADGRIYVALGEGQMADGGRYSIRVEAYGPVLTATPRASPAGLNVSLDGTNFAADASVSLYWGSPDGGILVATTRTTNTGAFSFTRFTVPDGGPADGPITAVDSRSRYPAFTPFTRQ